MEQYSENAMAKRRKTGPKSTGLSVMKSFAVTPKMARELGRIARAKRVSESQVIRAALEAFFMQQAQSNGSAAAADITA